MFRENFTLADKAQLKYATSVLDVCGIKYSSIHRIETGLFNDVIVFSDEEGAKVA